MIQSEYSASGAGTIQREIIARILVENAGSWVAMPLLARESGAYAVHSRISDLRSRGMEIEHMNEYGAGRVIKSFYRVKKVHFPDTRCREKHILSQ